MEAVLTILIVVIVALAILGGAIGIIMWTMRTGLAHYEPPEEK